MRTNLFNVASVLLVGLLTLGYPDLANCQEVGIQGKWKGVLEVSGQKLPLIFNLDAKEDGWTGTLDSPAQGAKAIPLSKVLYASPMLAVEINQINASYEGVLVSDTLKGNFTQSGMEFPLDLVRLDENDTESQMERPQEPTPPFEYDIIETSFTNLKAGITLQGTITKPKGMGPFPAVVLVTGSGPQDRNEELMGHKPFWVIADYFTRKGIAVLRYDERGVGESEGDFSKATTMDFKTDATLALEHLKKYPFVDQLKAGVVGHSEGGIIAWIMGAEERAAGFVISLAGPVVPIVDLMKQQTLDILKLSGVPEEIKEEQFAVNEVIFQAVANTGEFKELETNLHKALQGYLKEKGLSEEASLAQAEGMQNAYKNLLTPWYYEFLRFDPKPYIYRVGCPALAIFGGKDIQVNGEINHALMSEIIQESGSDHIEAKLYPELNHLFQKAETGAISEYAQLTETFNKEVMQDMVDWILEL